VPVQFVVYPREPNAPARREVTPAVLPPVLINICTSCDVNHSMKSILDDLRSLTVAAPFGLGAYGAATVRERSLFRIGLTK
jgi:hypothetical protein